MSLQIKGKFIQNAAIDGSKIVLKQGEALRAVDASGVEIELLKIGSAGEILANGNQLALKSTLDTETSRALAAEAALQAEIDAEESARIAAISAESSARETADEALQDSIDAEAATRAAAVSAEASARQAADLVLDGKITAEKDRAEFAESQLSQSISNEVAARQSAISGVEGMITAEQAARQSGDASTLSSAQAYADQKISELVNSAPAVLDTLKELSDALGGDENFAVTVAGQIGEVQDQLDAEVLARAAALAAEASARAAAIAVVQGEVDAEELRAAAAETVLQSNINSEASARQAADSALQSELDATQAGAGLGASGSYSAHVGSNYLKSSDFSSASLSESLHHADKLLDSALKAEVDARIAAVSAEQARAEAAEASLASDIQDLEDALEAAIGSQVNNVQSELDTTQAGAGLNSSGGYSAHAGSNYLKSADFTAASVTASLHGADKLLDSAIKAEVDARVAAVSAEESARIAAVSAEESARIAAVAAVQSSLNSEISDRQAAVSAEQSAREAADETLQDNIDAEAASRVAGDAATLASANSYTDTQVAALVNSAPAVLDTLKELADAINGDASFATTVAGQIGQVASDLAAEETRALAAESALQSNIDAEEARALAAEALKANKAGDTFTGEVIFNNADLRVKNPSGQTVALFDASESSATFGVVSADTLSTEMAGGAIKVEAGVNLGGAQTFIGAGFINLQESNGSAAMPTLGKHAAPKAYVDQEVSAEAAARAATDSSHNSRISALEAKAWYKIKRTLSAQDISNGYVSLDHVAVANSIVASVGRLMIHEGATEDFTVSTVGGVSRVTFLNSLVHPGNESLSAGDIVYFRYQA